MKILEIAYVLAASLILTTAASSAYAATFGVRVVDDAGMPVSGASVCFGLPGSYTQFGARFTDEQGQASAEVPNIPFVMTVSKTRFSGVRSSEPARGFNLIRQVTLSEGTPGPRCKAGSTLASSPQSSVRIRQVQVTSDARQVRISSTVTGEPTEYRLSGSPDPDNVRWIAMTGNVVVPAELASREVVYLQMRRYESFNDGWLEARSKVVPVQMPVSTPSL